jgi:protein gp37
VIIVRVVWRVQVRSINVQWVREIFRACRKQKVRLFFKQWGGVQKHRYGRELGGRTYDEMPIAA